MSKNPIVEFFAGVQEEARKVTWPSRQQTIQTTVVVIVATVIVAAFVGVVDYGLNYIIQRFLI
ncbi:preprotein translocase subunit SecE [Patescibacteria group bacterium]|nr:preprotein translocase subunit SecE [Patescibacteria group bacterium]